MTFLAAIAGPLEEGARIGLQLPRNGTCAAQVVSCDGRNLILELAEDLEPGALEEGAVVDIFLALSWGMYKWICLVSCWPGERKAEVQLLDAPMFVQRRLDPRVGVGVAADVRAVRGGRAGKAHRAVVADLSHGGLKLAGARQLRSGDIVEVTMDLSATLLPCEGSITLTGRVVMAYPSPNSDEPGQTDAHVCFVEGQQKAIASVDRFVAQQLNCRWRP
jgi:hypothetical protein